jgi:hypothetical protein
MSPESGEDVFCDTHSRIIGLENTSVADLPSRLRIERRAVEHQLACVARES